MSATSTVMSPARALVSAACTRPALSRSISAGSATTRIPSSSPDTARASTTMRIDRVACGTASTRSPGAGVRTIQQGHLGETSAQRQSAHNGTPAAPRHRDPGQPADHRLLRNSSPSAPGPATTAALPRRRLSRSSDAVEAMRAVAAFRSAPTEVKPSRKGSPADLLTESGASGASVPPGLMTLPSLDAGRGRAGCQRPPVRPSRGCPALPPEPETEMVGVTRKRETRTARPGILLAVRVFFSRYRGNSVPVLGNARWIPVPAAELTCRLPPRTGPRCRQGCDRARCHPGAAPWPSCVSLCSGRRLRWSCGPGSAGWRSL
jgi:hypothetical protein